MNDDSPLPVRFVGGPLDDERPLLDHIPQALYYCHTHVPDLGYRTPVRTDRDTRFHRYVLVEPGVYQHESEYDTVVILGSEYFLHRTQTQEWNVRPVIAPGAQTWVAPAGTTAPTSDEPATPWSPVGVLETGPTTLPAPAVHLDGTILSLTTPQEPDRPWGPAIRCLECPPAAPWRTFTGEQDRAAWMRDHHRAEHPDLDTTRWKHKPPSSPTLHWGPGWDTP